MSELAEWLKKLADQQRDARGDMMFYGCPDPEIAQVIAHIEAQEAEILRLRDLLAVQIAWTPGEPPKQEGAVVYGHTWKPYRWKAYSPKSEQFRHGLKGRWQAMNEYAGWDNAPAPDEWAPDEVVSARRAALSPVLIEDGEVKP